MADDKKKGLTLNDTYSHEGVIFEPGTYKFKENDEKQMRVYTELSEAQERIEAKAAKEREAWEASQVLGVGVSQADGVSGGISAEQAEGMIKDALNQQLQMLKDQGLLATPKNEQNSTPSGDDQNGQNPSDSGENKPPAEPTTPAKGPGIKAG